MPIIIDCAHVTSTDFTAAKGFKAMLAEFYSRSQAVYWLNPSQAVTDVLVKVLGDQFNAISSIEDISQSCESSFISISNKIDSLFSNIPDAPAIEILEMKRKYDEDKSAMKINLTVGGYKVI